MDGSVYLIVGIVAGFVLATFLISAGSSGRCCEALGRAALGKYGIHDLGTGVDSAAGGIIAGLGLA